MQLKTRLQSKVLVVDDERDVVELLSFNLRAAGYNVATAESGVEALNKARSYMPDLIILDLMLPQLDGTAVCEILRRLPSTAAIPVLMLTACCSRAAKVVAVKAGVDEFITKPFSPHDLVARVGQVLELRNPLLKIEGETI
ncbi:MAG: response regulator [Verrucomicrobiota bacterium]|nr:response regulator [Verrucomicrobiota bacterium]